MIFLELFLTFLMIGAFTFGGGYAMLPLIEDAVVSKGWIDAETMLNFIAVSESTPGPFAINIATYVGSELGGAQGGIIGSLFGAFCATMGVVTPSYVIILIIAHFFEKFRSSKVISSALTGIRPAVVGLIAAAAVSIGMTVLFPNGIQNVVFDAKFFISLGIFALMTSLSFIKKIKVGPIVVIVGSAVLGIICGYVFL